MDITSNTTVKTPEPETETPTRIQPAKPLSFSNGALTRHRHHHHHPAAVISYKECLKNHAASLGGHAVDGCGEFMPSPTATPADPTSLKCAACGCHRNFHRREPEDQAFRQPPNAVVAALEYQPHHRHHPPPPTAARGGGPHISPNDSPSPPPISSAYYPSAPHMLLALSSGFSDPSHADSPKPGHVSNPNSRKRFRTKFRKDQKEKMMEFAERLGWKMQKRDEDLINEFCSEIGVEKGVLKVWMHNNKYNFGRRDQPATASAAVVTAAAANNHHQNGNANGTTDLGNGSGDIKIHNHESRNGNNITIKEETHSHSHSQIGLNHHHLHNSSVSAHVAAAINGSSSSSGA